MTIAAGLKFNEKKNKPTYLKIVKAEIVFKYQKYLTSEYIIPTR